MKFISPFSWECHHPNWLMSSSQRVCSGILHRIPRWWSPVCRSDGAMVISSWRHVVSISYNGGFIDPCWDMLGLLCWDVLGYHVGICWVKIIFISTILDLSTYPPTHDGGRCVVTGQIISSCFFPAKSNIWHPKISISNVRKRSLPEPMFRSHVSSWDCRSFSPWNLDKT